MLGLSLDLMFCGFSRYLTFLRLLVCKIGAGLGGGCVHVGLLSLSVLQRVVKHNSRNVLSIVSQ